MISIEVPARIHVTLIGLGKAGHRINGGVGFAINDPFLRIRAEGSERIALKDCRTHALESRELCTVESDLERVRETHGLRYGANVLIEGDLPAHRGLGGGTAIRLAVIEALFALNRVEVTRDHLIAASGRGGTSGIGISTYFEGGMVFDIGRRTNQKPRPSHAWVRPPAPLRVARVEMPNWTIGVAAPGWIPGPSRQAERALFDNSLPVSAREVERTLYESVYGVFAAAIEADAPTFDRAITAIQKRAWKRAEWKLHGPRLTRVANELRVAGAVAVGLSSLGPTLYFLGENLNLERVSDRTRRSIIFTEPCNRGRILERRI